MTWQAKDAALCLSAMKWTYPDGIAGVGPKRGSVCTVKRAVRYVDGLSLVFEEWPNNAYQASAFCRLVPLDDGQIQQFLRELEAEGPR